MQAELLDELAQSSVFHDRGTKLLGRHPVDHIEDETPADKVGTEVRRDEQPQKDCTHLVLVRRGGSVLDNGGVIGQQKPELVKT